MADKVLATSASLLGVLGPWGPIRPGELRLSDGVVTFTAYDAGRAGSLRTGSQPEPEFSAPAGAVRVRSPRLYFGLGLKLIVEGKRYRLWFVGLTSAAGESMMDGTAIVAGNAFETREIGPARAATRAWRAALSPTG